MFGLSRKVEMATWFRMPEFRTRQWLQNNYAPCNPVCSLQEADISDCGHNLSQDANTAPDLVLHHFFDEY